MKVLFPNLINSTMYSLGTLTNHCFIEASLRKSESKFTFYLSGVEGKIPPLRKNFLLI